MYEANRQQASVEYEAARRALSGLASGASQHRFITQKMERMEQIHSQLQIIVGDAAIAIVAQTLNGCSDGKGQENEVGGAA